MDWKELHGKFLTTTLSKILNGSSSLSMECIYGWVFLHCPRNFVREIRHNSAKSLYIKRANPQNKYGLCLQKKTLLSIYVHIPTKVLMLEAHAIIFFLRKQYWHAFWFAKDMKKFEGRYLEYSPCPVPAQKLDRQRKQ